MTVRAARYGVLTAVGVLVGSYYLWPARAGNGYLAAEVEPPSWACTFSACFR